MVTLKLKTKIQYKRNEIGPENLPRKLEPFRKLRVNKTKELC